MSTFDWNEDTPTRDIISQACGVAAICWEFPEAAGEFYSHKVLTVIDEVMEVLEKKERAGKIVDQAT
jgi:hypothetical protein